MPGGGFDVGSIVAKLGAVLDPRGFRDFDRAAAMTEARAAALEKSVNSRKLGPKVDYAAFNAAGARGKKAASDAVQAAATIGHAATRIVRGVAIVAGATAAVTGGIVAAVGIKFDVLMQRAQIGFTTLLGSAAKARKMLADLQAFAATTPFQFADLVPQAQRMLAMGIAARKIIPDLRAVGDAEALLGGGKEGIDRVVTALGQMTAKSKVSAEEMRQLTEAGIPAWRFLADAAHKSISETMKAVTDGKISGERGVDAIVAGMQRKFGGGMAKISHTLEGQWSNLLDNLQRLAGNLVLPLMPSLTAGVARLQVEVGRLLGAKDIHAKARIVWDDVGSSVDALVGGIRHAVGGVRPIAPHPTSASAPAFASISGGITVPNAPSVGTGGSSGLAKQFEDIDWTSIGKKAAAGLAAGFAAASDVWGAIVTSIAAAVEAHAPELAQAGAVLAAQLVITLTDPAFWMAHWELALGVAIAVFPIGKFGKIGELLIGPFRRLGPLLGRAIGDAVLEAFAFLERLSPRAASIVMRLLLRAFDVVKFLATGLAEGLWGAIRGAFTSVASRGGALFRTIMRSVIITGIVGAVAGAVSAAANLGNRIVSAIGSALANVGHTVSAKVRQAANGIRSAAGGILGEARKLGSDILSAVPRAIGDIGGAIGSWITSHSHFSVHFSPHVTTSQIGPVKVPTGVSWASGGSASRGIFDTLGGIVRRPALVAVGEEAPAHEEFVIPTNPAHRGRALELLARASSALGIAGAARGDALSRLIRRATRLRGGIDREANYQSDEDRRYSQDQRAYDLSVEDLTKPAGVAKRRGEITALIGRKRHIISSIDRERRLVRRELISERSIQSRTRAAMRKTKAGPARDRLQAILEASQQRIADLTAMRHDLPFARRDVMLDITELAEGRAGTVLDTSQTAAAGAGGSGFDQQAADRAAEDASLAVRTSAISATIAGALAYGGADASTAVGGPVVYQNFSMLVPPNDPASLANIAAATSRAFDSNNPGMNGGTNWVG